MNEKPTTEPPEPSAPETLPKYVREPVARQSAAALRDLAAWADDLADWKEQRAVAAVDEPPEVAEDQKQVDDEEIDFDAVNLDDLDVGASVNIYPLKIPCGPGCDGCPHGPYLYAKWRDGDTVRTKYVGKP